MVVVLPHRIARAVLFSDVHLGWAVCSTHHARWLRVLPELVDDAELVVLNGDVVDGHRRIHRASDRDLVDGLRALVVQWRLDFLGAGGQLARLRRRPLTGGARSPAARTPGRYADRHHQQGVEAGRVR